MNENQRKFFATKYSEIPQSRIVVYSIFAATCFGIVGLMTGEIKINVIAGCSAITFIHLLGRWCDCERKNPKAIQWIGTFFAIITYVITFVLLLGITDQYSAEIYVTKL